MKRLIVHTYTGAVAANLAVAWRLSRKILGTQGMGQCVLVDFEDVEVSPEFLGFLLTGVRLDKVRFCGLPIAIQALLPLNQVLREERL